MRLRLWGAAGVMLALVGSASAAETAGQIDRLLAQENAGRKVKEAPVVEDLSFLRRVYLDLVGRIPTEAEIQKFLALPAKERRTRVIDELSKREQFADRWAIFLGDMLRIRSNADGGAAFLAHVHRALETDLPYDVLCRQLIAASGKANLTPEVGFVLGDDADPMALAGVTSQVFLGVRLACAQCHNHPFDSWTRQQFYDLAAFFGKTRRQETRIKMRLLGVYLTEVEQTSILWPPEEKAQGKPRSPVKATFPFPMDRTDGPNKHLARLKDLRERLAAEARAKATVRKDNVEDLLTDAERKIREGKQDPLEITDDKRKLDVQGDIYRASVLRAELAKQITDPRNRFFSRAIVNRVWAELLGRGFVNPVDDFKEDNPPSHAKTLDYLADEFVAGGYDFRWLVKTIVATEAYQRAHLPASTDAVTLRESQKAFVAATTRRMMSEAMYDSMVQAGHLFAHKHKPGENLVTITRVVQEYVDVKDDKKDPRSVKPKDLGGKKKPAMTGQTMQGSGYDLERSIEVDFKSALMKKDDVKLDAMEAKSNEEIEAEQMMMTRPDGKKVKMVLREVKTTIDDNPRFTSSMRMASPAPVGHFLRVFGQTDRSTLDERRDHSPSMRQALMMLNGQLTNHAARVGALEPMHVLLVGPKADLDQAVRLAYRESLTREPSADELADAKEIIQGAKGVLDGMADLRWALLNSNEFRYLP